MSPILLEVAQDAIMVAAGLVFTLLGAVGTYYINKLVTALKQKEALEIVGRYVRWAEQAPAYQDLEGGQKFELVFGKVVAWLEANGISVNSEELAVMIESAVQQLREAALPIYEGI
jgi:DNA polymerase I-like protein with 3'-5' exonuclease and polymerase domains